MDFSLLPLHDLSMLLRLVSLFLKDSFMVMMLILLRDLLSFSPPIIIESSESSDRFMLSSVRSFIKLKDGLLDEPPKKPDTKWLIIASGEYHLLLSSFASLIFETLKRFDMLRLIVISCDTSASPKLFGHDMSFLARELLTVTFTALEEYFKVFVLPIIISAKLIGSSFSSN